jgi:hypothetical protein
MKKLIFILFGLLTGFLFAACGHEVEIESNTDWSGTVGSMYISGNGDASYDMDEASCVSIHKNTKEGYLIINIKGFLGNLGHGETDDEYGKVDVCEGLGF